MKEQVPDFSDLAPHIAAWGLPTLEQRREKRLNSSIEELRRLHDAVIPRLEAIVAFLDRFPLDQIPQAHLPLSYLALAMCEIDDPVNKWGSAILDDALDPRRFTVKRSFYDTDAAGTAREDNP